MFRVGKIKKSNLKTDTTKTIECIKYVLIISKNEYLSINFYEYLAIYDR